MKKDKLVIRGIIVVAVIGIIAFIIMHPIMQPEEPVINDRVLEMRSFLYTQDFEEFDPVEFWAVNREWDVANLEEHVVVNFKGLTEEKSRSGRNSFKIDVTFKEGGRLLWYIPISRVPAEGDLKFSGHIFLGEETIRTDSAGIGVCFRFTPVAVENYMTEYGKREEWRLIEGDLVKLGKNKAKEVIGAHVWGAKGENVGIYVDRIGLFLWGGAGQRVVMYVDDVKIEGEVPTEEAYQEEIKRMWAPAKARFEEKISSWEKTLKEAEDEMALLTDLSEEAGKIKRGLEERISFTKERVETVKSRGYIYLHEQREIDPLLKRQLKSINNIKLLSEEKMKTKDMILYVVPPVSTLKILPFDTFIPGEISDEIRVIATPGEYEPASFVVSSLSDMTILAEATDLRGEKGVIPSDNIDIKIVKCWFQGADAWRNILDPGKPGVLVPELLLNDASLVKVDHERQENYLRLSFSEGERYVWISDPNEETGETGSYLSVEDFPVKDSPYLLPVHIPARTNKQFWVTIKVPDNTQAGIYTGNITLSTEKETLATITIKLRVLPFKLSSPKTFHNLKHNWESSIYYMGRFHPDYPNGTITEWRKSKEQLKAELKNMFAHGITNPTVSQCFHNEELFRKHLTIRNEIGMAGKPLYYLGDWGTAFKSPDTIKRIIELAKSYGIPEVYFYGIDEARGEALTAQRPYWEAVRGAGGKIFVANFIFGQFEAMGDIQDLFISGFFPSKEEAAKWHSVGHRIFLYNQPQVGAENPEIYRRNFGLFLWKANYDGAMNFAYQCSYGNIWNDFDHPEVRDHNFAYPTINGVITTIALAGYREGIDDIRYATTLRLSIEEAKKSEDRRIREKADEARRYLAELDTDRDLDTIRMEIISHILGLLDYSPHRLSN